MLKECYGCPFLVVQSYPSIQGDGYGNIYTSCNPPMGECPAEFPINEESYPAQNLDREVRNGR